MNISGNWVLIPLKAGASAKSRLSSVLDARQRTALQQAMLEDQLEGLSQSRRLSGIALYGTDEACGRLAARHGLTHLLQPDHTNDMNAAVEDGSRQLASNGAQIIAVLPGDLPLLDGEELDSALAQVATGRECAVIPDRQRTGTNGLIFPSATPPPFHFGADSFWKHLQANGFAWNCLPRVVELASLALDIDTLADLELLCADDRVERAWRTRALVDEMTLRETAIRL